VFGGIMIVDLCAAGCRIGDRIRSSSSSKRSPSSHNRKGFPSQFGHIQMM